MWLDPLHRLDSTVEAEVHNVTSPLPAADGQILGEQSKKEPVKILVSWTVPPLSRPCVPLTVTSERDPVGESQGGKATRACILREGLGRGSGSSPTVTSGQCESEGRQVQQRRAWT